MNYKQFTIDTGRECRVFDNLVIEAKTDDGEWKIIIQPNATRVKGRYAPN